MADNYFKVDTDNSTGEYPHKVPIPDTGYVTYVNYLTGETGADKFAAEAVDPMGYVQTIPATPDELDAWLIAHTAFKTEVEYAHEELRTALARWSDEVDRWKGRIAAAAAEYLPIHEEIEHRKEIVELEREVEYQRLMEEKQGREIVEEAVDVLRGDRGWFFITPDPGRMEPIIHRRSCRFIQRALERKTAPWIRKKLGLIAITRDEVLAKRTEDTRMCRVCHAEHHLNQKESQ